MFFVVVKSEMCQIKEEWGECVTGRILPIWTQVTCPLATKPHERTNLSEYTTARLLQEFFLLYLLATKPNPIRENIVFCIHFQMSILILRSQEYLQIPTW